MELLLVDLGIYHLKMHFKVVRYQMSHCYLCSKSKTNMKKWYFECFIPDYFPALNKKDPVVQVLIDICLLIPHNLDTVIVNTKIPLHQPKSYLNRRNSSKRQSRSQRNNLCNNDELYLGQTVQDQFKPAKTKWKITRLTTFKSSSDYHYHVDFIIKDDS